MFLTGKALIIAKIYESLRHMEVVASAFTAVAVMVLTVLIITWR